LRLRAVLFDLDGTLVDTAPDLVAALNALLHEQGRAPMPYATARNEVSNGAVGLLKLAFGASLEPEAIAALRARFLAFYEERICDKSRLFIELEDIINVTGEDVRFGVVTNKPASLTVPLLDRLGVAALAGSIVSGDTLRERKPHPAPLELAARELGLPAAECIYIGDAARDIEAGRAAGMRTVAAAYGYIRPQVDPAAWGADLVVGHPRALNGILQRLERTDA
jgi:N-acetyl-D-muramate 6-phosphate phosphatase